MSSLYTEIIQDAYRRPAHRGTIEDPTHDHQDENPLCGDTLRVQLRVENDRVIEAKFDGAGCAISQAAAELLMDRIQDQPLSVIRQLDKDAVLEELGMPTISPARLKCALLSLGVLRGALRES
jgi:nitrogen fixation NifU-like protein